MEGDKEVEVFTHPDGGYGWIIVLATTLINISLLPLVQCFGIIYEEEFKVMGITSAKTSFLLHLHSAIYCSLGLLGSPLLKKYDFRKVALAGTSLMSLGILLSSFAHSYGVLIFTFSVIIGVGQGVMLPSIYLATNTYFKKRLTLAVSFSVTGASISFIIMPPVIHRLLNLLSTQNTILVLAALSVCGVVCCFLLKPIKKDPEVRKDLKTKEEIELLTNNEKIYNETTVTVQQETLLAKINRLFDLALLKERQFVITIVGMAISFAAELNIIVMISFILPDLAKFQRKDVAFALSVQSIADITGRLLIPIAGHYFKIHPKIMYCGSLIISTIGRTAIAFFFTSSTFIFLGVTLIGLAKGMKAVYQSVIIPKYVPLEKLPAANGLNMLLTGAVSLALGPIIGAIHDVSGSYTYTLHTASVISMSCVVLWLVHFFGWERKML